MRSVNIKLTDRDKELREQAKKNSRLDYPTIDSILMSWALRHWEQIPALMSPMEKIEASR